MFDIGIQELIVIFVVALLVFGPKRLPEIGRALGKGLAEFRKAMQGVKDQIDTEMRDSAEVSPDNSGNEKNKAISEKATAPWDKSSEDSAKKELR